MKNKWKQRVGYGIGTLGRDMVATMVTMYMFYYMTDVLRIPKEILGYVTSIIIFMRFFDGFNDPIMGSIIDNTKTKWGKFKPWIFIGMILWGIFHVLMFFDTGLQGSAFLAYFFVTYLLWEISYTMNDIAYWSMIPSLSRDQKEKEKIGSTARIFASIGMFAFVVGLIPISNYLAGIFQSKTKAWLIIALASSLIMIFFQTFTLIFVKEEEVGFKKKEKTGLKEILKIIIKNDQLLVIICSMLLFMAAYTATTGLGIYYFKYVFGDENKYSVFALILGVSQIAGLAIFPILGERLKRTSLYLLGLAMVVIGYVIFYMAHYNMMIIGIGGTLIFVGEAFIQMLMLMYISDSVEYGQWKFRKRNDSVTSSVQPLIYKSANAFAGYLTSLALMTSGISGLPEGTILSAQAVTKFKVYMFIIPVAMIVLGGIILLKKYKIDEAFYAQILKENEAREEEESDL